jgi:hypothetical protein
MLGKVLPFTKKYKFIPPFVSLTPGVGVGQWRECVGPLSLDGLTVLDGLLPFKVLQVLQRTSPQGLPPKSTRTMP